MGMCFSVTTVFGGIYSTAAKVESFYLPSYGKEQLLFHPALKSNQRPAFLAEALQPGRATLFPTSIARKPMKRKISFLETYSFLKMPNSSLKWDYWVTGPRNFSQITQR